MKRLLTQPKIMENITNQQIHLSNNSIYVLNGLDIKQIMIQKPNFFSTEHILEKTNSIVSTFELF